MSKRYSTRRSSRRRTRQSLQSEISGVLDPDSNVGTDDEGDPLWFQRFQNNSVSVRPSKRFSAVQNDNTLLDPNSDPDSTPLQNSWWKDLDNTPDIQANKRIPSDAAKNKSHVSENHIPDSDVSNVSSVDESLVKQRSKLRRNKRKSLQKNVFSQVLESSNVSVGSEKGDRSTQGGDNQDTSVSPPTSDTSKSPRKVRKLPFKKGKYTTRTTGSEEALEGNPKENLPNVFDNILEASQSISSSHHENIVAYHSDLNLSIDSLETLQLRRPLSQNQNEAQNNSLSGVSTDVSESLQAKSRRKKQTVFTATRKRKTPNFSELLNDKSEDEQLGDQSSSEELVTSNQKQATTDVSSRVSESPQPKLSHKKRTVFTATRKRKTPNFSELLNDESEDEQLGDQSSSEELVKSSQKQATTDVSSRVSESPQPKSSRKTRTVFTATRKRKTPNFSELLNDESEDEQLGDQSSSEELVKSSQKQATTDVSSRVSESPQAKTSRNKRTISTVTRKRKTQKFSEILNDESENEQPRDQLSNEEVVKSSQKEAITDVNSRVSESPQATTSRNRQTISTATEKTKTPNFSESLNDESEDEQLGDQPSNAEMVKSSQEQATTDVGSRVSESPQATTPRNKRTISTVTRKRKTQKFSELLNDESENEQPRDQPSNEEVVKSSQKEAITDVNSRVSESPQAKTSRNRQTISTATEKRKTPNFSESLNDESEDEQLGDQPSNAEMVKSSQKQATTDVGSRVSESPQATTPRNKRTISTVTRKRKTQKFSELLNDESENEQPRDQPSNEEVVKSSQKEAITDVDSRVTESAQATTPRNKQTISTATEKRKTPNFSESLNDESEDEQLGDQPSNEEVVESNQNEVIPESGTQPSRIIDSPNNILTSDRDSDLEDSIEKSRATFLRKKRRSYQEQAFAQALESSSSMVHSETPHQREKIDTLTGSGHKTPESDFGRESLTRKNYQDKPVRPLPRLPIRRSRSKSNAVSDEIGNQSRAASEENFSIRLLITSDEEQNREDITTVEDISNTSVSRANVMPITHSSSRLPEVRSNKEISRNDEFQPSGSTAPEEVASSTRHKSPRVQNVENVSKSLPKIVSNTAIKSKGLFPVNTSVAQDVTDKTTNSDAPRKRKSMQHPNLSQRVPLSTEIDTAKATRLKGALEEVKKKFGLPQNSGIESYFIKTAKPKAAVINAEKFVSKENPVRNKRKMPVVEPNKAYIVDGKVYKRPKLPRPKPWATDRLYNFLWKHMEPKYNLKTRVRSEKFITVLSDVVSLVTRRKKYENYAQDVEDLMKEMAHLGIIKTRNDFHIFCQDFLPYDFRIKVVPMILPGSVRNIPFHPKELHKPIL